MPSLSPADELVAVRADIARLKARERVLCDSLVAAPACARKGRWTQVEVAVRTIRLFDHRLLPAEVRDDPLLWRERQAVEVLCHPTDEAALQAMPVRSPVRPPVGQGHARAVGLQ